MTKRQVVLPGQPLLTTQITGVLLPTGKFQPASPECPDSVLSPDRLTIAREDGTAVRAKPVIRQAIEQFGWIDEFSAHDLLGLENEWAIVDGEVSHRLYVS